MRFSLLHFSPAPFILLAACAPTPPASTPPPPALNTAGLEKVIGHDARALVALFGEPDLDIREGPGRKLQFTGPVCVLDAYLYAPAPGQPPVATYVDARTLRGDDYDRVTCVAALARRPTVR